MHFGFTDDQLAVRDAVAGLLDKRATLPVLQLAWADPGAPDAWSVWRDLAGMGVHGLLLPEKQGGSGMDWVTMALVLAEAGRVALPLPLLETAAVGVPLLAAAGDTAGALPGLIDGSSVLTVDGQGEAGLAPAGSRADWFLVDCRLYRRDEVSLEPVRSVDRTRDLAAVTPEGPGVPVGDPSLPGALAAAAVLIGLGRAIIRMTVGYVSERRQFGVPVGSFQAVKHHLADATMHVEFAAPAVWAAAWEYDQPGAWETGVASGRLTRCVSLAKALASDAAERAARVGLQCHGAMGYTDEYHLHMWMKRVWCLAASFGSSRGHRRVIGGQLGLNR